jgi:putative transposase
VLRVLRDYEVSQRRACGLIGVDPKTVRRERPPDHSAIRAAMKEVAGKRRRFGYRRIGIMLERKGMIMNHKKLYRLYREEGLSVGRRRGRKRARGSRTPMPRAAGTGGTLVDGLCVRHLRRITQVQDFGHQ